MVEQTTHVRDAIALLFQMTDADQIDQIITVATQRRLTLTGEPAPTSETIVVLDAHPTRLLPGTRVRINSHKNYSFHGLTGRVTRTTTRGSQPKVHILCDPSQKRTGMISAPITMLEVIK